MKFLKSLCIITVIIASICFNVSAKSTYVEVDVGDNSVGVDIPSDYTYITSDDVDKPAAFFKNLPVDKNEVISRINNNGVIFDAFSNKSSSEIKFTVNSDNFSKTVANFTPMDDSDKASVVSSFKSGIEQSGHAFLNEPKVKEIDGYDFIEYNCRIGSGEKGYCYKSVMTIIGGKCYEFTCYSSMSVPDDDTTENFDLIINSIEMNIKGESGQIAGSVFKSVIAIGVIIVAAILVLFLIYSLILHAIAYKNRKEKVKLKKR